MNDLEKIKDFVTRLRADSGVTRLGHEVRLEISGQAYPGGEIALLVERQLAYTHFGHGSWQELRNPQVLKAILDYIG